MKTVILAGGLGTRISEETISKPKPMVEIGGRPILWHIMKIYSFYGINDFIICCGYKGYVIKEYFLNYALHMSDVTIDVLKGKMTFHQTRAEPWQVTLVDTGEKSMTGGRLLRIKDYVKDEENFCFTYGDGLTDVNINHLIKSHLDSSKIATLTATNPPSRFGAIELSGHRVTRFVEKPSMEGGKINGGFFVLSPKVFDYLEDDTTVWEQEPLQNLASDGELNAFIHNGFFQPMDTVRDKMNLETMWNNNAPWKVW